MKKSQSLILAFLFSVLQIVAQSTFITSESCDCIIDTAGLATYLSTISISEDVPLTFSVESPTSEFAVLYGYIDGGTPDAVQNLIMNYPNVTTLVFMQMPGSDNDEANLIAAQMLKEQSYKFYLPSVNAFPDEAFIASGAVDMFFAGDKRVIDAGADIGVHSWSDGTNDATDFPVGDPVHSLYIDYYIAMGLTVQESQDFYYFTINAAPASGIYWMTDDEIEQYKLRTCKYSNDPVYTTMINENIISANLNEANYQWVDCDNGNEPIVGATEQFFIPVSNGNYAVQITEENCSGISDCNLIMAANIHVSEIRLISISPNPTTSYINLNLERISSNASVKISNIEGKIIETWNVNGSKTIQLNRNYESGIYFLSIIYNDKHEIFKLLIQ